VPVRAEVQRRLGVDLQQYEVQNRRTQTPATIKD
jgi:hypothetical protein